MTPTFRPGGPAAEAHIETGRARRPRPVVRCTGPGAEVIAGIAGAVPDPELPMISLADLGVLRAVDVDADSGAVTVTLTPTYSGCPALRTMADDVAARLESAGYPNAEVRISLTDTWSTDDLTSAGAAALQTHGIAPPRARRPAARGGQLDDPDGPAAPACPHCGSRTTEELSRFGSTSCKALHRCLTCREPFEYFKDH